MEKITSKDNKKLKEARKLLSRKGRKESGRYLIEGFHLLEEAVKSGFLPVEIFISSDKLDKLGKLENQLSSLENAGQTAIYEVSNDLLKTLADSETPQGLVAVLKMPENAKVAGRKVLVLEDVQDPGNVGTMVRTADAAGFDAVFATAGTADFYSPKVMRAMQGSNFHLKLSAGQAADQLFASLKSAGLPLFVTTLSKDSVDYKSLHSAQFALVMGNEGAGVSDLAVAAADQLVHITMPGQAESLNVAVAAGILMFSL